MAEHPDSLWQPFPGEVLERIALRREHARSTPRCPSGRALEILEERFARGEISARELEERRAVLRRASA